MLRQLLIIVIAVFQSTYGFSQGRDSLRVYLQGICHGEKYRIYYNYKLIHSFDCRNKICKKYGKSACCSFYFSLPVDTLMKPEHFLELKIYKKTRLSYKNTYLSTYYDPTKKYLIVWRNHRLQKRYAVDPMWRDEKLIYE